MHRAATTGLQTIFQQRRAGVLLPITALPNQTQLSVKQTRQAYGCGVFDSACRFIDWIASAGFSVWQLLPLGPTHSDHSPYLCLSSLAGESHFIGLRWLQQNELLDAQIEISTISHRAALIAAHNHFTQSSPDHHWHREYDRFCHEAHSWLHHFALFMALHQQYRQRPWYEWPAPLRDRHTDAIAAIEQRLNDEIAQIKFAQFLFFKQWSVIRHYAEQKGIFLFGDMPMFVAHDSADVWANRDYFKLNSEGQPQVVAGVPPDYFSSIGQRWGNPHYNWPRLQRDHFCWWIQRLRRHLELFHLLRIDHFRGLDSAWEIPLTSHTAAIGQWQPAPGKQLLSALHRAVPELPLVAEDLGLITTEVTALRQQFRLPGMAVLQFAFDGNPDNPYLPDNLRQYSVLYTGTHDNDTSLGWFVSLSEQQQQMITHYLHCAPEDLPLALIKAALASVAQLAIIPLQDILGLGSEHRTNTPGTVGNNWLWRFQWQQLQAHKAQQFLVLNRRYGRCK